MNTKPNLHHDIVDNLLESDALAYRNQYIDDNGFTTCVINTLPDRRYFSRGLRTAIPLLFSLFSTVFVIIFTGIDNFIVDAAMDVATKSMTRNALACLTIFSIAIAASIAIASDS